MAIIKKVYVDKVEVLSDGQIQVRTATIFIDNGVESEKRFVRKVIVPGANLTNEDPLVRDIGQVVHTPQRVEAYLLFRRGDHPDGNPN